MKALLCFHIVTGLVTYISKSEGLSCGSMEFACSDGSNCIPILQFCDGSKNCLDGSDEPYRTNNVSEYSNETVCRRGKDTYSPRLCILPPQLYAREEELCEGSKCEVLEFPCADGSKCIPRTYFCDGIKHCPDGSDEIYRDESVTNHSDSAICHKHDRACAITTKFIPDKLEFCKQSKCPVNTIACRDGSGCINIVQFCNGWNTCRDQSKEPLLRYNNMSYDADTTFCHGRGAAHFYGEEHWSRRTTWICVMPASLESYRDVLCDGSSCDKKDFSCSDGSQCIRNSLFCNGKADCSDGSDEPAKRSFSKEYAANVTFCRQRDDMYMRMYSSHSVCVMPPELLPLINDLCDGSSCKSDEFPCADGSECILGWLFYDGKEDCKDGSDEPPVRNFTALYNRSDTYCRQIQRFNRYRHICVLPPNLIPRSEHICDGTSCGSDEFGCLDGSGCIPAEYFCNGNPDCSDGSDEPSVKSYHARGDHTATICVGKSGKSSVCVLQPHLVPHFDTFCSGRSCRPNQFPCSDGSQCIPAHLFCNGHADCWDKSDEPPLRKSSVIYGSNMTFCRGRSSAIGLRYGVRLICVIPQHLPYEDKICEGTSCRDYEIPCFDNTSCIWERKFCDGVKDCRDNSDEQYMDNRIRYDSNVSFCRRGSGMLDRVCNALPKIHRVKYCDGSSCHSDEYSCDYGATCVRRSFFCDGMTHCTDGTDEKPSRDDGTSSNATFCRMKWRNDGYNFKRSICQLPANLVPYKNEMCEGSECTSHEFTCANGELCILEYTFCDGTADCDDGSDEVTVSDATNMSDRLCPRNGRQCLIPIFNICDGVPFCDFDIDECLCGENKNYYSDNKCFRCLTDPLVVLPISKLCNGEFDCRDLTDECLCSPTIRPKLCEKFVWESNEAGYTLLPSMKCDGEEYTSRKLIAAWKVCDGRWDCPKREDEEYCQLTESRQGTSPSDKVLDYKCYEPPGKYGTACDGIPECNDFMDEECNCDTEPGFCDHIQVYDYDFTDYLHYQDHRPKCRHFETGSPIDVTLDEVCDGMSQCKESADELGCKSRFYCSDQPLPNIAIEKKCDMQADCDNGTDEADCPHFSCKDDGILQYISQTAVCDGIKDCMSGIDECQAGCIKSAFSDEKSLIASEAILAISWIISLTAIIGCTGVVAITLRTMIEPLLSTHVTSSSMRTKIIGRLILSLSFSDMIVGIYAFSICIKATRNDTDYCHVDREWRSSSTCSALGAIMVIGSEQSVFTMAIIATQRLHSAMRPLSRPHLAGVTFAVSLAWVISILLGTIPLIPQLEDYFVSSVAFNENRIFKVMYYHEIQYTKNWLNSMNVTDTSRYGSTEWSQLKNMIHDINPNITVSYEFGYYSSHGVCLPTFFPDPSKDRTWRYSFFLLLVNFLAFLYMSICYVLLFRLAMANLTGANSHAGDDKYNEANRKLQRKLTRIVITDFLCWIPICIMGFLTFNGVNIPKDVYLPAGLLIVPINSALNPLLYSDLPEIVWEKLRRISGSSSATPPRQSEPLAMTERAVLASL